MSKNCYSLTPFSAFSIAYIYIYIYIYIFQLKWIWKWKSSTEKHEGRNQVFLPNTFTIRFSCPWLVDFAIRLTDTLYIVQQKKVKDQSWKMWKKVFQVNLKSKSKAYSFLRLIEWKGERFPCWNQKDLFCSWVPTRNGEAKASNLRRLFFVDMGWGVGTYQLIRISNPLPFIVYTLSNSQKTQRKGSYQLTSFDLCVGHQIKPANLNAKVYRQCTCTFVFPRSCRLPPFPRI